MLPRRHILDVWEMMKNKEELLSMATMSLAIDAVKYMHKKPKKDHLVEALELNEFICYMFPAQRPKNRSLLYHIVSDLLGLLMYGVPSTRKHVIENIEIEPLRLYINLLIKKRLKGDRRSGQCSMIDVCHGCDSIDED